MRGSTDECQDAQLISDSISQRHTGGSAPESGVLSVHAAACASMAVLRQGPECTVETEGIEKGHQQQYAHHAEDDGNDDDVNVYMIIAGGKVGGRGRGYGVIFHFVG